MFIFFLTFIFLPFFNFRSSFIFLCRFIFLWRFNFLCRFNSLWRVVLSEHRLPPALRRSQPFSDGLSRSGPRENGLTRPNRSLHTTSASGLSHFRDRKSTRLNSSHVAISYAVFCLKKKIQ